MNNYIKNALDNFDLDLLSCHERKVYLKCIDQPMSKRAALLSLIDNYKDLNYDLQEIGNIINEQEKNQ